jgi:hypothetical protein
MNIFFLFKCWVKAAQAQCDRHVVKMILEMAQLLSSTIHCYQLALPEDEQDGVEMAYVAPYKKTHVNHPMRRWTAESEENFLWTLNHGLALCDEYTFRYGKRHKTQDLLERIRDCYSDVVEFPKKELTVPPTCTSEGHRRPWVEREVVDQGRTSVITVKPRPESWDELVGYYRSFYLADKMSQDWCKWAKGREMPAFLETSAEKRKAELPVASSPVKRRAIAVQ